MVEQLLSGALLVHHPGEKLVERVSLDLERGQLIAVVGARLGKDFDRSSIENVRCARFTEIVEGAVGRSAHAIIGGVAVLHQVVPARKDDAAKAVDNRIERTAGRVLHLKKITTRRIEAPQAGVGRHVVIFVQLR